MLTTGERWCLIIFVTSPHTTNTNTGGSRGKGGLMAATSSTFSVLCPCGCGTAVLAHDAGFSATSVEVEACPKWAANGIVASTMRKSWAYANAAPVSAGWQHHDGLVVFG